METQDETSPPDSGGSAAVPCSAELCLSRDGGRQPTDDELIIGALEKAANRAETGGIMSAEDRRAMKLPVREIPACDRAYVNRCRAIIQRMRQQNE